MLRIDSKRLPLRLKTSCTDVLNPSLMADIVTEQRIQIQRFEQALHITHNGHNTARARILVGRAQQSTKGWAVPESKN
ncbi:unnamed protein product [Prunus armeniaca]